VSIIDYPNGSTNANAVALTDGSTQLQVTSGTATQSGIISETGGSFGLEKIGSGTLIYTGVNTYTGLTIISDGTLQIGNGGTSGNVLGDIVDNGLLVFNRANTLNLSDETCSGVISGTGALQTDSGLTVLTGTNTYTGGTTIAGGALRLQDGGSVVGDIVDNGLLQLSQPDGYILNNNISGTGSLSAINITGTVTLTGNNTYTGGTQVSPGGSLQIGNGGTSGSIVGDIDIGNTGTVIFNRSDDITFAGFISFNGTIVKRGAGALVLSGHVSSGNATVTAGTLQFGNGGAAGPNAYMAGLGNSGTVLVDYSDTFDIRGVVSGAGSLRQIGTGTLLLSGANTYTGGTTISGGLTAGTIAISSDANLGGANGALTFNNGTLKFLAPFNLSPTRAITLQGGSGVVNTIDTNGFSTTISQVISGSGGLVKTGGNTLTLSAANTFTGGVVVTAGDLALGSSSSAGTNSIVMAGTAFATLDYANGITVANNVVIQNNSAWLTVSDANGTGTESGVISGSQSLVKFGYGMLILTGNNSYTGGTNIKMGTLEVSSDQNLGASSGAIIFSGGNSILMFGAAFNPNPSRAIVVNNTPGLLAAINTNGFDITLAQGISGSGDLAKTGNGVLTLNSVGTFSGTLNVNQGILRLGVDNAVSLTAVGINGGGYGTLDLNNHNLSIGGLFGLGDLTLGSGTLAVNGASTWDGRISGTGSVVIANTFSISNANSYTGGTTVTGTGNLSIGVNNTGSISGNITDNGIVTFNRDDATTFSGAITGTGSVIQANSGTTTLTGTNTYSGGTVINFGALRLGNGGASGSIVGNVTNNRSLIFNRSDATTFAGVISGTGSVTDAGVGTTTLTGTNTYTGGTTINSGATLLVDGAIASSAVTVASSATLGGSGTVGTTSIQSGGKLAPGDGIGTLQVNGNLTLASGATYAEELSPATADEIIVSGSAGIAGNLTINLSGSSYGHQTYTLLHSTGTLSGTFANVSTAGLPAGLTAELAYGAHDVTLTTDHAPAVTTSNRTVAAGATVTLSSLFTVGDADGDSMTKYQIWDATRDPNAGYVTINGMRQPAAALIEVMASQLSQTSFVTGTVATNLQIRAFDGFAWSAADNVAWAPFTVGPPPNHAPVVTTSNKTMAVGATVLLSTLFNVSDADGDAMTKYQIWDGSHDPNAGYITINSQAQPAGLIEFTAGQLSQVAFVMGTVPTNLQIRAFDGQDWSALDNAFWSPFTVSPPPNTPPVVTTSNRTLGFGTTVALSTLFSVSDADSDSMTKYQIWDASRDPNAGYVAIAGVAQPAGLIEITAAQLYQTSFVMGTAPTNMQIRAFDGRDWSAADSASWSPFTVSPQPNTPPVVMTSNKTIPTGAMVALSGLFSVGDADGDPITKYQLWESTRDANAGYVTINGNRQPAAELIEMTAAQMAQASFVVGTVATNLQIRAFDGKDWSAADNASWAPFNISPGTDHTPVLTTTDKSATAGQSFALSNLFNVTDADGDTMTKYQLWDGTAPATNGHFVVNGQAQSAGTLIEISAALLSQTSFIAGQSGASDSLQIRAFDGFAWSAGDSAAWAPFHINVS